MSEPLGDGPEKPFQRDGSINWPAYSKRSLSNPHCYVRRDAFPYAVIAASLGQNRFHKDARGDAGESAVLLLLAKMGPQSGLGNGPSAVRFHSPRTSFRY